MFTKLFFMPIDTEILSTFLPNSVTSIEDFYIQSVPTIEVLTHVVLKSKIKIVLNSPHPIALHEIIGGERGAGKSTTLLFLKQYVDELKKESNGEVYSYYTSSWNELSNFYTFLNILRNLIGYLPTGEKDPEKDKESLQEYVNKILQNKKIFLFIDVPDTTAPRRTEFLSKFAETVEILYGINKISVLMAFNPSFFEKFNEVTDIVGKFGIPSNSPSNWVSAFTIEQTENFILNRLNKTKKTPENSLKPFADKTIPIIYQYSRGIPRNILTCCSTLLHYSEATNLSVINNGVAEQILKEEYAKNVTKERITDETERQTLNLVYDIIDKDYKGAVSSEQDLFNYIKKKKTELGIKNKITLRKYLGKLEKLRLIDIRRNPKEKWKNLIRTKW